jgi:hypothetical protein
MTDAASRSEDLGVLATRMLGGSLETFLARSWRIKHLWAPGAASSLAGAYSVDDYLRDLAASHFPPFLSVGVVDGIRDARMHQTIDEVRGGVEAGGVVTMKLAKLWHRPELPLAWLWMRSLFGELAEQLAMIYLGPERSEDVDVFLSGPSSRIGTHFDVTDNFTIQLCGQRRWEVEEYLRVDELACLADDPSWHPAKELDLRRPCQEIVLHPGDCLYVPAYAVHRVTGVGWSVSVGLGLRSFTEVDVVSHLLELLSARGLARFTPLPSVPASAGEAHVGARLELLHRVQALTDQLLAAAVALATQPLELPPTLAVRDTDK